MKKGARFKTRNFRLCRNSDKFALRRNLRVLVQPWQFEFGLGKFQFRCSHHATTPTTHAQKRQHNDDEANDKEIQAKW